MLTVKDVRSKIREIRKVAEAGDFERAHGMEDELYREVLKTIRSSTLTLDVIILAEAALRSQRIKFYRVCA